MPFASTAHSGFSSLLSVSDRQPPTPDDQGLWIRIPTRLLPADAGPAPSTPAPRATPVAPAPFSAPKTHRFRRCGLMREILFGGVAIAVADRMGMRIYEELLTHPHRRFTAVELRAGMSGLAPGAFLGSSGPVVTANGIDALRRAYEDLNEDLAEAELQQDVRRQERIERELGALADELRRAVGRDGSPRQQTDASRARVAVAKALLRTRAELRHLHRPFHDYLVAAVTTGSVLRFSPLEGECWDC